MSIDMDLITGDVHPDSSRHVTETSLANRLLDSPPSETNSPPDGDSPNASPSAKISVDKPYHSKRPHKKSRAGCKNCKRRKVKCNEERPSCQACTLRKETCVYPRVPPVKRTATQSPRPSTASPPGHASAASLPAQDPRQVVFSEPLFRPACMADAVDMRMLWFWTARTYGSFSIEAGRSPLIDYVLKVKVVEHAFRSPFLMDCLMALSALEMQKLDQDVSPQRAVMYRAKAFAGYRNAIESANPADYPALLACSLLMAALSTQMFREPDPKPLYIVDWMQVWKGIGLIVQIIPPRSIRESGLAAIFHRAPVNIEKSSRHIPDNLLSMVNSIASGDADYEHQQVYYETLQYLGSLYAELNHGFGPMLDLRTISWFTFIPTGFIPLAKMHHPRALIILAYYLCFAKMNHTVWWMQGIADPEIDHICRLVGHEWDHLLRIPKNVRLTDNKPEIARIITENQDWAPEEVNLYERHVDGTAKYDLTATLSVDGPDTKESSQTELSQPSHDTDTSTPDVLLENLRQIDPTVSLDSPLRKNYISGMMPLPPGEPFLSVKSSAAVHQSKQTVNAEKN